MPSVIVGLMMLDDQTHLRHFPFPSIRDEQRKAIEFTLDAFASGTRYVLLEMGTGCGKSPTGIAIARHLEAQGMQNNAYVLTTQKILQEQYVRDFGPGTQSAVVRSIKSSSNYACGARRGSTCAETRRVIGNARLVKFAARDDSYKVCRTSCPYAQDKRLFIESSVGVTNFAFFLAETMYAGKLMPRGLLVIDECHTIEAELGRFVEVTFSERFARDVLKIRSPRNAASQDDVFAWICGPYKKALVGHIHELESSLESSLQAGADLGAQGKELEVLDKHVCKVNRFIDEYDKRGWVINTVPPTPGTGNKGGRRFEFKPVSIASYSESSLFRFGDRVLMMSATVVDKDVFCRSIGLDPAKVAFLRLPSPFPVENRQVHFMPVGSMSRASIDSTLPKMAEGLRTLLAAHPHEKGIIHAVNYRIARYLTDALQDSRLLLHDSTNRDDTLRMHAADSRPTVLISPSMMEGVDLTGDLSRFQVLVKVPYPYLGDEVVKRRMALDPNWYAYQTARSIMQALGRSVRSMDDHAVSYILDADWDRFYRQHANMFPAEFKSAMT